MRNEEEISVIRSNITDPFFVPNFLLENEISYLIKIFEESLDNNCSSIIKKNTGPVTLNLNNFNQDQVVTNIIDRLKSIIGNYVITAAFFYKTEYPHVIHNDDTFELPNDVYKGITLPLKLYGENVKEFPQLCFFDQLYFHGPAKFFKNENDIPTYYNEQIYDYSRIENLAAAEFDQKLYETYFTHLKKHWLDGMSIKCMIPWIPRNAIIFDSIRLHCASDFRRVGVHSKLGISIFTKKT